MQMLFESMIILLACFQLANADAKILAVNLYMTAELAKDSTAPDRILESMQNVQKIYDDAQLTQPLHFQYNGVLALPTSAGMTGSDVQSTYNEFSPNWQTQLSNTTDVDMAILFTQFTPSVGQASAVGVGTLGSVCQMQAKGAAVVDAGSGMTTVNLLLISNALY